MRIDQPFSGFSFLNILLFLVIFHSKQNIFGLNLLVCMNFKMLSFIQSFFLFSDKTLDRLIEKMVCRKLSQILTHSSSHDWYLILIWGITLSQAEFVCTLFSGRKVQLYSVRGNCWKYLKLICMHYKNWLNPLFIFKRQETVFDSYLKYRTGASHKLSCFISSTQCLKSQHSH